MKNWAQTIDISPRDVKRPRNFIDIFNLVRQAQQTNRKIKAVGSGWSFTDNWVSDDILVDTSLLDRIHAFSRGRNAWHHKHGENSTEAETSAVLIDLLKEDILNNPNRRFAHIEAGITIRKLIDALDTPNLDGRDDADRWALPTMGGASGQTLAGAISTATHGGDFNLSPIADMVRAIHVVGADGKIYWVERTGSRSITDPAKVASINAFVGAFTGVTSQNVIYDDNLFRSILVSNGRFGVIYSFIIEVRSQFGLSERVVNNQTWNTIRPLLLSGDIFTGTRGLDWLSTHPNTLANGVVATKIAKGVGVFINPYRINSNYDDASPDRNVMLVTQVEAQNAFDVPRPRATGGISNLDFNLLVTSFEAARGLNVVHGLVNQVIAGLRNSAGTTGYPVAHSILDTNNPTDRPPILSFEIAVSTTNNNHVRFIDRMLEIFDTFIRDNWARGNQIKFAGGLNLRYTAPTSAFIGMQAGTASGAERFCHIEIIVLKELAVNPFFWDPPRVHDGHHNLESDSESWTKSFENTILEFGARMHWGQLNQLNRKVVESGYGDGLARWKRSLTKFLFNGNQHTFSNWFSKRTGLEPYFENLAGCSWGENRYDLLCFNEKGEVQQLAWNGAWNWANLGNGFTNGERFISPLTATSWGIDRLDAFGIGANGEILQLWYNWGWTWTNLSASFPSIFNTGGGILTGYLASCSPSNGRIELFALKEGGQIMRYFYNTTGWHSQNLGNSFLSGERFVGHITTVSWSDSRIDIFGVGKRGQILQLWRDGGEGATWNWSDLSAVFPPQNIEIAGPLSAESIAENSIDIFCKNRQNNILRVFWDGAWQSEVLISGFTNQIKKLGMPHEFGERPELKNTYNYSLKNNTADKFVGPLVVVGWGGERLDIFGFGESNQILQTWRDNTRTNWNWANLGNAWIINPEVEISAFSMTIKVGGDPLADTAGPWRNDRSTAWGFIKFRDGRAIEISLNEGQLWNSFTFHEKTIALPAGTRLSNIRSIGIRHQAAGPDFAADNWHMDEIKINYISTTNEVGEVVSRAGNPVWTFQKNANQVWEHNF